MKNSVLGNKIVVVGTTGSGKTTFAKKLSKLINITHYELDDIFWKPGWEESVPAEFREKVKAVTDKQQWIIDGNYAKSQDLTVEKAETVIWLDCSKSHSLYRVFMRSVKRIINRKPLWKNNRETMMRLFSPKVSILFFAYRSYIKKKNRYNKLFAGSGNLNLIRLKNKRDEKEFWENLHRMTPVSSDEYSF